MRDLAIFHASATGHAQPATAPFTGLSDDHPIHAASIGKSWCVSGVSATGRFVGACRPVTASAHASWNPLPQPPGSGSAVYDMVGIGNQLYALVTTSRGLSTFIRAYRLQNRKWRRAGGTMRVPGGVAKASALYGDLVVTVITSAKPILRVVRLQGGRWRSIVSRRALGRLRKIRQSPLLGTPQRLGGDLVLGLSQREITKTPGAPLRYRFGIASLRTGSFVSAPGARDGQAQGLLVAAGNRSGWAIWNEFRFTRGQSLRATIRAARLDNTTDSWRHALAKASTLVEGEGLFGADTVVTKEDGRHYVVHPRPAGPGRRVYAMTPLE